LHNGDLSLWTALVNYPINTGINEVNNESINLIQSYPNPAIDEVYISFKLQKKEKVSLTIYNPQGQLIANPFENNLFDYGKHVIHLPLEKYNLTKGVYFYSLSVGDQVFTNKLIVE
jgi:hypothetical protein